MVRSLNARDCTIAGASEAAHAWHEGRSVDVVIVGAGIAGLGAAYRLHQQGVSVLVLEGSNRVGGAITTLHEAGRVVERGPSSYLSSGEQFAALVESLGLGGETLQTRLRDAKRYIYASGSVQQVPMGLMDFIRTGLLSGRGKLRILSEPFQSPGWCDGDESLASFIERRLGREALDRLVFPMISGVYAGDPEQLSAKSVAGKIVQLEREHGSIVKGFIKGRKKNHEDKFTPKKKGIPKTICTVRGGLLRVPETIADRLQGNVVLNALVAALAYDPPSATYRIEVRAGADQTTVSIEAKALIIATPVNAAANLVRPLVPGVTTSLQAIPVNRLCVVTTVYRREDVPHSLDGFGFLVARNEPLRILGSLWYSSIFPAHCPKDEVILSQFVGGARFPELVERDDAALVDLVREDLRSSLAIAAEPREVYFTRWSPAIAQPPVGHPAIVERIQHDLKTMPGLALAGNYLCGISMNDALLSGWNAADAIQQFLSHRPVSQPS